jgi:hypothetical protein
MKKFAKVITIAGMAVLATTSIAGASSPTVAGNWTKAYYDTTKHDFPTAKVTNTTSKTVKAKIVVREGTEVMEDTVVTLKPKQTKTVEYQEAAGAGTYNGYVVSGNSKDSLGTFKMK